MADPSLPPAKGRPLFRVAAMVALAIAASLAGFLVWSRAAAPPKDGGFAPRGLGNPPEFVKAQPALRALCMQGTQVRAVNAECAAGDALTFAVTPHGRTHVKLSVVGGAFIGEGDVADGSDLPLPWTVAYTAGMKLKAELATCPTCATASVVVFAP